MTVQEYRNAIKKLHSSGPYSGPAPFEYTYADAMEHVLMSGDYKENRTGIATFAI